MGTDYGNVEHYIPYGVVQLENVDDLIETIEYAACNNIEVVPMGQRHSVYGQAQVANGYVLNMTLLNNIEVDVSRNTVWVEAGATWKQLLAKTLEYDLTPPVFTDYVDLSIGGTISVGGIGAQTFRVGLQVDNVNAIYIVDGKGQLRYCNPNNQNKKLFHAAVAGYGQFGVITKVQIPLVPAFERTLTVQTLYNDLDEFIADLYTLLEDERYDGVQGFPRENSASANAAFTGVTFPVAVDSDENSDYVYMIEGSINYDVGAEPVLADLLQGLSHIPGSANLIDTTYYEFITRLDPTVAFLKSIGIWQKPHPKMSVYISRAKATAFIRNELALTTAAEVGGPIFVYPCYSSKINVENFPLPSREEIMLFGFSRTCEESEIPTFLQKNDEIYYRALDIGGKGYAIDAIPLNPESWEVHFGTRRYDDLEKLKKKYDPAFILTPSQFVFEAPSRVKNVCNEDDDDNHDDDNRDDDNRDDDNRDDDNRDDDNDDDNHDDDNHDDDNRDDDNRDDD